MILSGWAGARATEGSRQGHSPAVSVLPDRADGASQLTDEFLPRHRGLVLVREPVRDDAAGANVEREFSMAPWAVLTTTMMRSHPRLCAA